MSTARRNDPGHDPAEPEAGVAMRRGGQGQRTHPPGQRTHPTLRILSTGPLATIQDLGRPGWFHVGVGVSGAADVPSLMLANRLVGNDEGAAAIECLLGGLELEPSGTTLLALTGAPTPVTVDGTPMGHASVITAAAGSRVRLGMARVGMRSYLAVRGGVAVEPVLGSCSRDTLAGLGPEPLRYGMVLPIGPPPPRWPCVDVAPVPPVTGGDVVCRAVPGPRDDWFVDPEAVFDRRWTVSTAADRVGVRLDPAPGTAPLARAIERELPTEGMPLGAIQVPPSGQPVVFLADHPITGGYPAVATLVHADVPLLAQARPGQRVVFRRVPAPV